VAPGAGPGFTIKSGSVHVASSEAVAPCENCGRTSTGLEGSITETTGSRD
jgi:hypothetical protein